MDALIVRARVRITGARIRVGLTPIAQVPAVRTAVLIPAELTAVLVVQDVRGVVPVHVRIAAIRTVAPTVLLFALTPVMAEAVLPPARALAMEGVRVRVQKLVRLPALETVLAINFKIKEVYDNKINGR